MDSTNNQLGDLGAEVQSLPPIQDAEQAVTQSNTQEGSVTTPPIAPVIQMPVPPPIQTVDINSQQPTATTMPIQSTSPMTPAEQPLPLAPAAAPSSLQAARFSKSFSPVTAPATTNVNPQIQELIQEPVTQDQNTQNFKDPDFIAPQRRRKPEPKWLLIIKAMGVFFGTYALVFLILESPAYFSRVSYFFTHLGKKATTSSQTSEFGLLPTISEQPISLTQLKETPTQYLENNAKLSGYSLSELGDNELLIPKISVKSPIVWDSPPDEATMLQNLQNGVVHYNFSAHPSDGTGKVFISGHSSYYMFDPGKYKTIFANLDRLETGDQMAITYKGLVYIYQVTDKQVVKPTDVSVVNATKEPTLSLMTCYPVGTSLNRLVVTSRLISSINANPIPLPPPEHTNPASIFYYLPF